MGTCPTSLPQGMGFGGPLFSVACISHPSHLLFLGVRLWMGSRPHWLFLWAAVYGGHLGSSGALELKQTPYLFQVSEMRRTLTPANSPVSSPSKHGDRFIPSRAGANWSVNFHRINVRAWPATGTQGWGVEGTAPL